jgi:hypothetical protein
MGNIHLPTNHVLPVGAFVFSSTISKVHWVPFQQNNHMHRLMKTFSSDGLMDAPTIDRILCNTTVSTTVAVECSLSTSIH